MTGSLSMRLFQLRAGEVSHSTRADLLVNPGERASRVLTVSEQSAQCIFLSQVTQRPTAYLWVEMEGSMLGSSSLELRDRRSWEARACLAYLLAIHQCCGPGKDSRLFP